MLWMKSIKLLKLLEMNCWTFDEIYFFFLSLPFLILYKFPVFFFISRFLSISSPFYSLSPYIFEFSSFSFSFSKISKCFQIWRFWCLKIRTNLLFSLLSLFFIVELWFLSLSHNILYDFVFRQISWFFFFFPFFRRKTKFFEKCFSLSSATLRFHFLLTSLILSLSPHLSFSLSSHFPILDWFCLAIEV